LKRRSAPAEFARWGVVPTRNCRHTAFLHDGILGSAETIKAELDATAPHLRLARRAETP